MDAIFYNNIIAKILQLITGRSSFAIGPFIITALANGLLGNRTYNKLATYTRQWTEITVITFFLTITLTLLFIIDIEWIAISPFIYYIWYIVEYFIKYFHNFLTRDLAIYEYDTSDDMAFHIEADIAMYNPNYHKEDNYFAWVKYLIRRY